MQESNKGQEPEVTKTDAEKASDAFSICKHFLLHI